MNRPFRRTAAILVLLTIFGTGCRSTKVVTTEPFEAPLTVLANASTSLSLNLGECQQMALERNPRLATFRSTLASAEDGKRALERLRLPATLDSQVPIRRQQASLGVTAAAAGLEQAERDVAYAVTRSYFTAVFAREQERVAKGVVDRLKATRDAAQQALEAGAKDVTGADVSRTSVYLRLSETRHIQAAQGVKRALVALREAIGLGPDVAIDIPDDHLPMPTAQPNRDEIVTSALTRRGDLRQAKLLAQVAALEADAQRTSHGQRMQTFAGGSDIHAQQIPQGSNGADYRPGAIPPEMPAMLVGSRGERVKHALTLSGRAEGVFATSRNLIALEAEDAFLRWEETSAQSKKAREAAEEGEKMADDLRKDFAAGLKIKVEEVVSSRVLASQARSEFNEFLFKQIVALADLERVSGGAFNANLGSAAKPQP